MGKEVAVGGMRSDLGIYCRSKMEANYARYLNFLIKNASDWESPSRRIVKWEYEAVEFLFPQIKKGTRFYKPDFKVSFADGHIEYHEVKGYMDSKSKTQLKRFQQVYPQHILVLIESDFFKAVKDQGMDRLIPGWE